MSTMWPYITPFASGDTLAGRKDRMDRMVSAFGVNHDTEITLTWCLAQDAAVGINSFSRTPRNTTNYEGSRAIAKIGPVASALSYVLPPTWLNSNRSLAKTTNLHVCTRTSVIAAYFTTMVEFLAALLSCGTEHIEVSSIFGTNS